MVADFLFHHRPLSGGWRFNPEVVEMMQRFDSGFRLSDIDPLSFLLLTSGGIQLTGAGCSSLCLSRSVTLCLSPDTVDLGDCSRGPSRTPQAAAASSIDLAGETLVSNTVQAPRGRSLEPSLEN